MEPNPLQITSLCPQSLALIIYNSNFLYLHALWNKNSSLWAPVTALWVCRIIHNLSQFFSMCPSPRVLHILLSYSTWSVHTDITICTALSICQTKESRAVCSSGFQKTAFGPYKVAFFSSPKNYRIKQLTYLISSHLPDYHIHHQKFLLLFNSSCNPRYPFSFPNFFPIWSMI